MIVRVKIVQRPSVVKRGTKSGNDGYAWLNYRLRLP